ncbi:MAG TPA: indole-3-glycerol phosphate synthase TrpC [Vicinamibacterales bacterium]|nr:indole-3-glycerol phosphate synthase TrpC [Vicinamibacterales bacterium]
MSAPDLLAAIVAASRRISEVRQHAEPLAALERRISRAPRGEGFRHAVSESAEPRIIAECKRRSPSRGILRQDYRPAAHASAYAAAGAAAISVLTEPTFFDGSPDHLSEVRAVVNLPILRKDFLVTDYQMVETAVLGADAALLIAGAIDDRDLARLIARAGDLGLAALVEVHDRHELARALDAGATLVGVNSRNLRTLAVDHAVLDDVAPAIPRGVVAIAESGISSPDDLGRLAAAGYDAFLVGERLIAAEDPGAALMELRGRSACA